VVGDLVGGVDGSGVVGTGVGEGLGMLVVGNSVGLVVGEGVGTVVGEVVGDFVGDVDGSGVVGE
jgi:hypothetical protein